MHRALPLPLPTLRLRALALPALGGLFLALGLGMSAACESSSPAPATDVPAAQDAAPATDTVADVAPDAGPDTAAVTCNAILQEGCGEGENCRYGSDKDTKATCFPAGKKLYGQQCAGVGDCAEGMCMDLNGTGSRCYRFCKTEIHCQGEVAPEGKPYTGACSKLSNASYMVCELDVEYDTCDLLNPTCPDGKGCYVIAGQYSPVCLPAGAATEGESCDAPNACAGGLVCINKVCHALCDKTDDSWPCGDFVPCSNHYGNAGYCDD